MAPWYPWRGICFTGKTAIQVESTRKILCGLGRKILQQEDRETLSHIDKTLDKILAILSKPAKIGVRALEIAGAVVSVLGILSIIDIIRNWIFGG